MFGRRRRRLAASAAMSVAEAPVLRDEQIFELLHDKLADLIGENGAWTLSPRSPGDTDVIFHGLKARQVAVELTETILTEQATLRGESSGEPTALSWTPAAIVVWNDPVPNPTQPVDAAPIHTKLINTAPIANVASADDDLAAASAAWIDKASATLASARFVA
ncbi:hypothetical protein [Cryobacterium sp. Y50]|uniref:hypothetical protein n=1 Tax=Cryobacterium sp. Y50 TaxID=2048286 RepID=UPI0011B0340F|nr:hypothetical protein [Cryobacterium sp. Y50]